MNLMSKFDAVAMDFNGLLMQENYAWVDRRLEELYYGYALTSANCDEYEAAGILTENYAWVDQRLEEMCSINNKYDIPLCNAAIPWANYRSSANLECIDDEEESFIGRKRRRSESDISDYEDEADRAIQRLSCQSPIPKGEYVIIPNYDEEVAVVSEVSTLVDEYSHCATDDDEDEDEDNEEEYAQVWPEDNIIDLSEYVYGLN